MDGCFQFGRQVKVRSIAPIQFLSCWPEHARTDDARACFDHLSNKKGIKPMSTFLVINYILFLAKFFAQTIPYAMRNH